MEIVNILKNQKKGVSFEFFPPKTESGEKKLKETAEALKIYKPLYASMTYGAGGTTRKRTKDTVSFLLRQYKKLEIMPHLTCIGSSQKTIKDLLDEYKLMGVKNLMALRGDIPDQLQDKPLGEFRYALDIVRFIKSYGHFCISVAVYPQGHFESKSLEKDLEHTKLKIDAGADFAVSQMFFDNRYFYDFMERAKAKNINIPIIPGILPLTNLRKVERFCSGCGVKIPENIKKKLKKYENSPEEMLKAGLDITINQCRDLVSNGFRQLHIFTLNKAKVTGRIVEAAFD